MGYWQLPCPFIKQDYVLVPRSVNAPSSTLGYKLFAEEGLSTLSPFALSLDVRTNCEKETCYVTMQLVKQSEAFSVLQK